MLGVCVYSVCAHECPQTALTPTLQYSLAVMRGRLTKAGSRPRAARWQSLVSSACTLSHSTSTMR